MVGYQFFDRYQRNRAKAGLWIVRVLSMIPAVIVLLLVYLARHLTRWYVTRRAENWPRANALVSGSYEFDENQSVVSRNGWGFEEDDDEYYPRFGVALEYSYRVEGETYADTYILPQTYAEGDLASEPSESGRAKESSCAIIPPSQLSLSSLKRMALPASRISHV